MFPISVGLCEDCGKAANCYEGYLDHPQKPPFFQGTIEELEALVGMPMHRDMPRPKGIITLWEPVEPVYQRVTWEETEPERPAGVK